MNRRREYRLGLPHYSLNIAASIVFSCTSLLANAQAEYVVKGSQGAEIRVIDPFRSYPVSLGQDPAAATSRLTVSTDTLALRAARGETESGSLVVTATTQPLSSLSFSIDALASASGATFAGTIELKIVKEWFQGAGASYKRGHVYYASKGAVLTPELLVHDDALIKVDVANQKNYVRLTKGSEDSYLLVSAGGLDGSAPDSVADLPIRDATALVPLNLEAGESRQIWVNFTTSSATVPGTYNGKLKINSGGDLIGELAVSLEVLPILLPEPSSIGSIYYRAKLDDSKASVSSEYKSEEQLRAELADLKAHGVSNPTVYQKLSEEAALRRYLGIRRELGMNGGPLYYLGFTTVDGTDQCESCLSDVEELKALASEYGFTELYVYGVDEAKGDELIAQRAAREAVQQRGAKVVASGRVGHMDLMGSLTNTLVLSESLDASEVAKAHSLGSKILSYNIPQSGPEDPNVFRYRFGLAIWQVGFDGAMPYAYQHGMGSIWNDFDHSTYRDHAFTYPTANGVLDTIAWEGYRESIDDLRYLAVLEQLVSKQSAGSGSTSSDMDSAKTFLETLRNQGVVDPAETRAKVIAHILTMSSTATAAAMPQVRNLKLKIGS